MENISRDELILCSSQPLSFLKEEDLTDMPHANTSFMEHCKAGNPYLLKTDKFVVKISFTPQEESLGNKLVRIARLEGAL